MAVRRRLNAEGTTMNDAMLKALTKAMLELTTRTNPEHRDRNRDRGQTAVEYLGIIVVVVAVMAVIGIESDPEVFFSVVFVLG